MTFEEELINEVRCHPVVWDKWNEDYKNRQKNETEWDIISRNLNKTTTEVKNRWRNLRDVFQKELKKVRKPRSGDPGSPNSSGNYTGKWAYFNQMIFLKDVMAPRPSQGNYSHHDDESQGEQQYVNDWECDIDNLSRTEQNSQLSDKRNSTVSSRSLVNTVNDNDDDDDPLSVIRERNKKSQRASTSSLERNVISQSASTSSLDSSSHGKKHKHNKSACSEFESKMLILEEEKIKAFKEKRNEIDDEDMLFLKSLAPYFRYLTPVQKLRLKSKLQNLIADEIAVTIATPSPSPSTSAHSPSILPTPVHASTLSTMYMSPPSQTREFYESFNDEEV